MSKQQRKLNEQLKDKDQQLVEMKKEVFIGNEQLCLSKERIAQVNPRNSDVHFVNVTFRWNYS